MKENTDLDEEDGAMILATLNRLPMADRSLVLDLLDRLAQDVPSIPKETEG